MVATHENINLEKTVKVKPRPDISLILFARSDMKQLI